MVYSKRVYEALPTMYVLAGVFSANLVDNWMAFFSGAIFTMAGVLVFNMRISHRDSVRGGMSAVSRPNNWC